MYKCGFTHTLGLGKNRLLWGYTQAPQTTMSVSIDITTMSVSIDIRL
jgi:hypothetical protein